MAWTCPSTTATCPTSSKPVGHHVLELALASLNHPMSTPRTRAPSPGRNRRCSAGRHSVEHPVCTPHRSHPRPTGSPPSRPDTPRHAHTIPCTPDTAPCHRSPRTTSPRTHPCRPRHSRTTRAPHCPEPLPAIKSPPLGSTQHHTTSTTPSPSPRSPGAAEEELGAPLRAARPPRHAAAAAHRRRRHRRPAAAPTTLRHHRAAPEPLAAGRCLPGRSLSLPVLCPVGLRKMAVGRRSRDQRPWLVPARFDFLLKLLSPEICLD